MHIHCHRRTDMTTRPTAKENAKRFASVIQALQACEAACTHCATEFGKNGHAEAMARCIGVCTDCAEYCALTRKFLERNSEFAELLLEDCAEICSQCAEECDHHGQGHCSACATACRACLDACLKVAGVEAITAEPTVF
ncbi:four-helix bundle copper-binding protein [Ralstonia pickettii]|nr:four-helix bundle copper-binding protein [Ralstonia pickettii]WKZ87530.1 four-helix bundle copper-binding protein [Ralstonia pickettii]